MKSYASIFKPAVTQSLIDRVNLLTPQTPAQWGKMNVGQMLAHCNIAYDIDSGALPVKYNFLMRFFLKKFVKDGVVNDEPYPKNGRTAPIFVVSDERDFTAEQSKLIGHLQRVQAAGAATYEGRKSASFGAMTAKEWSNQFHKHLDHHLMQFGV